jgi:hypothetical protein
MIGGRSAPKTSSSSTTSGRAARPGRARARRASAARERLTVAMPAVEAVAARDVQASGESSREAAWLGVLAGIVHDDRRETVGGTRHARPTIAPR